VDIMAFSSIYQR